jgi:hypothetical protein
MVVGYSALREAEISRGLHENSYGLTPRAMVAPEKLRVLDP